MGGKSQNGSYTMDTRFNREHLAERIRRVAEKRDCIDLYCSDVRNFIDNILPKYADRAFCYYDPAYVKKGSSIYIESLKTRDHVEIAKKIINTKNNNWIITYDNEQIIRKIYEDYPIREFELNYSISSSHVGREIMIFGSETLIPDQEKGEKNGRNCHV